MAALSEAIRESRLDRIETLIQSPRLPTQIRPLHIAAAYASLESLEILVSAGFRVEAVDHLVRSALHRCATNRSEASALCACFLGTLAPKLLMAEDKDGLTPLDTAVLRHNKGVFAALLHLLGPEELWLVERAKALALKLRHEDLLPAIERRLSASTEKSLSEASGGPPDRRTLQVWERFFENALSFAEARDRRCLRATSASQVIEEEWSDDGDVQSNDDAEANVLESEESVAACSADLEVLRFCLSCVAVYHNDDFAIVNPSYGYNTSLAQHLLDYCPRPASSEEECEELPTSVSAAVSAGWVSFFDCEANDAFWYNALTGRTERHLPIGANYSSLELEGLCLEDEYYLCANYSPCYSWAMLFDEDLCSDHWSCYNFTTGSATLVPW